MSVFTIKYFGISMRAAHLKAAVKEQMCKKVPRELQQSLLSETKRYVIVEVLKGQHRVVGRREPIVRVCFLFLPSFFHPFSLFFSIVLFLFVLSFFFFFFFWFAQVNNLLSTFFAFAILNFRFFSFLSLTTRRESGS